MPSKEFILFSFCGQYFVRISEVYLVCYAFHPSVMLPGLIYILITTTQQDMWHVWVRGVVHTGL